MFLHCAWRLEGEEKEGAILIGCMTEEVEFAYVCHMTMSNLLWVHDITDSVSLPFQVLNLQNNCWAYFIVLEQFLSLILV